MFRPTRQPLTSAPLLKLIIFGGVVILSLSFVAMYNGDTFYMSSRGGKAREGSPWSGVLLGSGLIAYGLYQIWKSKQPPAEPEPPLPQDLEVKNESRLTRWLSNGFAAVPTLLMLAFGIQELGRPVSEREGSFLMTFLGSIAVYGACFLLGFAVCKAIERSVGIHSFVRWFILLCASASALGVAGLGIVELINGSGERAGSLLMIFGVSPMVFLAVFMPLFLVAKGIQQLFRRSQE